MDKIISLDDSLSIIEKYNNQFYNDCLHLLNEDSLFVFVKNKKLFVFNGFTYPKIKSFDDIGFYKLFKGKKLTFEESLSVKKILTQILDDSQKASVLKKALSLNLGRIRFPISELRINLSNYCTLNCKYCFQKTKNTSLLSLEDCYKHIDNFIQNNPSLSTIKVTLCMTSEPLLNIDHIKKIYYYIQQKCLDKLRKETSKEELYNFLGISTDQEYEQILTQRDYYLSAFKNIDARFISNKLNNLDYIQYCEDKALIKQTNEEVIYSALSASKNLYYVWFCTNGTILPSEKDLKFLKMLFTNDHLGISLDGNYLKSRYRRYKNGKSSYKDVINNIKEFQKRGINLEVHSTLNDINYNIIGNIKFLKKLGLENIYFSIEKGCTNKKIISNITKLYAEYNKGKIQSLYGFDLYYKNQLFRKGIGLMGCPGHSYTCIGYDGKTYFCDYFINKKIDGLSLSNLSIFGRPICKDCKFNQICDGVCFALTGDESVDQNSCEFKKEIIKQTIFYFCEDKLNKNMEKTI